MTDSYRGDSCGSFEFLTKSRRTSSGRHDEESEDEDEDDQRLFFPHRNEEKAAILRQIQTLNDPTTEESRESSVQPESEDQSETSRPVDSHVLDEIQKSIRPPPLNPDRGRTVPLVVSVAEAARNPARMRGKPSRLRDLQQAVPMDENPKEQEQEPQTQRYFFNFQNNC
jgi:hypothetical protein